MICIEDKRRSSFTVINRRKIDCKDTKLLSGGFGVTGNFAKQDSILKNEIKNDII